MLLHNSDGFKIVELDGNGGLKFIPVLALVSRDEDDRTVEPVPTPSTDLSHSHAGRLLQRPDGLIITPTGKVGQAAAAIDYFAKYRPSKSTLRPRFPQRMLSAQLKIDANGRVYYADDDD